MDILLGHVKVADAYLLDKFEFPFYVNNYEYKVWVYFNNLYVNNIVDGQITVKVYSGEYILNNTKLKFTVNLHYTKYFKINNFTLF